jgi:hypothetical protein
LASSVPFFFATMFAGAAAAAAVIWHPARVKGVAGKREECKPFFQKSITILQIKRS